MKQVYEVTVTVEDGTTKWKLNGKFHREDGPAIEYTNGDKFWVLNGKLHREDGPAIEYAAGDKFWLLNGEYHREDGPAIEYASGVNFWYLNNVRYTEAEFKKKMTPVKELTVAEIEKLLGFTVKVVK